MNVRQFAPQTHLGQCLMTFLSLITELCRKISVSNLSYPYYKPYGIFLVKKIWTDDWIVGEWRHARFLVCRLCMVSRFFPQGIRRICIDYHNVELTTTLAVLDKKEQTNGSICCEVNGFDQRVFWWPFIGSMWPQNVHHARLFWTFL